MKEILLSVAVMALVTYMIRLLPLVLFKKKITNIYVKSFMEYVPCVVLSCMTFPAIFTCTGNTPASVLGSFAAIILGLKAKSLVQVAAAAVLVALTVEILMMQIHINFPLFFHIL